MILFSSRVRSQTNVKSKNASWQMTQKQGFSATARDARATSRVLQGYDISQN